MALRFSACLGELRQIVCAPNFTDGRGCHREGLTDLSNSLFGLPQMRQRPALRDSRPGLEKWNALFLRYRYSSLGRLQSRPDLSGNLVNVCFMA